MFKASNAPSAEPITEVWRSASAHGYLVSSLGRVKNAKSGRVLRPRKGQAVEVRGVS